MKPSKSLEWGLTLLFALYIIYGSESKRLANIVDIPQIKIFIIMVTVVLLMYCNNVLGVLGIFVAYELLSHSHRIVVNEIETPNTFYDKYEIFPFPKSVEEDIIYKMMPTQNSSNLGKCSYSPSQSCFIDKIFHKD